jgi:hypothetical protein
MAKSESLEEPSARPSRIVMSFESSPPISITVRASGCSAATEQD